MLTPDMLSPRMCVTKNVSVSHGYPDDWDEAEMNQHRYDDCPCSPEMVQIFHSCGHDHGGYWWRVMHKRIPRTEST